MPTMPPSTASDVSLATGDLNRLKAEYADRKTRFSDSDIYSPLNRAYLFFIQQRQRYILDLLRDAGIGPLADQRVLEIGCGYGGVLHEFQGYGMTPRLLHGTELLAERVGGAHSRLPQLSFTHADGQCLPYAANRFDIVFQYTVFSSILDDAVKTNIAQEMRRVVKKPGGLILWYDFWLNPSNPQTRGIRPAEIRRLFPDCRLKFHRITLAPPLARRLVPISWIGCAMLEKLRVFNTHYLVAIHPTTL